jgi:hypothetical protein
MARKLRNEENQQLTWFDLEYGEKHWKTCEMINTHCRTWNMGRHSEECKKWEYTL